MLFITPYNSVACVELSAAMGWHICIHKFNIFDNMIFVGYVGRQANKRQGTTSI